jgi:methylthioribulose-1-phosphate dehydratase
VDVDAQGRPLAPGALRPSAETLLHATLYRHLPQARVVLHTHPVHATVVSLAHADAGEVALSGFEILKGLEGVTTHDTELCVPVLANRQDVAQLSALLEARIAQIREAHGFLVAGHGFYTWGHTPNEAKRHTEVFEYVFECLYKLRAYGRAG